MSGEFKFAPLEYEIIKYWKEIEVYKKICDKNSSNQSFRFMDGPPFPNSKNLHYGHLLVGYIKSVISNYKQMCGYRIENTIGFDCHGVPMEMVANKELGIETREDVYKLGVDKYNQKCKELIYQFVGSWEDIYDRIGRLSNRGDRYMTMDETYMESVWWVFKTLYDNKLIYRGFKIMPYSTKCETSFSNFEAGQNYKEVVDMSIYVKFHVPSLNAYLVIWTTTPWTLPSNLAVCVNSSFEYTIIETVDTHEKLILHHHSVNDLYPKPKKEKNWEKPYHIIGSIKGEDLHGVDYIPPFNYYPSRRYIILNNSFVDESSGTGVVHLAPAFGEVDSDVCAEEGVISRKNLGDFCPVTDNGIFTSNIKKFAGMMVTDSNTNKEIIKDLKVRGLLVKTRPYKHNYPFCWRTDTPLIYKAVSSYFVDVLSLKSMLIKNNKDINWIPQIGGVNKFGKWLEGAKDWGLSRSRFWGTVIPMWVSSDGEEVVCIGSVDELIEIADLDYRPTDLHLDSISHIKIKSKLGKGFLTLDGSVFDCWFESGSVPISKQHYPFKTGVNLSKETYLSDLVCEGIDQTRGWFYTLLVIATGLFNSKPFKNCISTGLILGEDGKKLSKRLGNFVSPMDALDTYGSDTMRLYLVGSTAANGESTKFSTSDIKNIGMKLYQFYNGVLFAIDHLKYFESEKFKLNMYDYVKSSNVFDHWIISRLRTLCCDVTMYMEEYTVYKVPGLVLNFIEEWTNWYLKFNRSRIKGRDCSLEERKIATSVMIYTLIEFSKIIAPFMPFITEDIYCKLKPYLRNNMYPYLILQSIHHFDYPTVRDYKYNKEIESKMNTLQKVISSVRALRSKTKHVQSVKIPLNKVIIKSRTVDNINAIKDLAKYFVDEVNTLEVEFVIDSEFVSYVVLPNIVSLGKKYRKNVWEAKTQIQKIDINKLTMFGYGEVDDITFDIDGVKCQLDREDISVTKIINIQKNETQLYELVEDTLVIIDFQCTPAIVENYSVRLFVVNIQNMRKNSGLKPWNKIGIYYDASQYPLLEEAIGKNKQSIETKLTYPIYNINNVQINDKVIIDKIFEIKDVNLSIEYKSVRVVITDLVGDFFN